MTKAKHVCKCAGKCSSKLLKTTSDSLMLVKVGSDSRPASPTDIKNIQTQLAQIADDPNLTLVTHHAVQVEVHHLKKPFSYKTLFVIQAPNSTDAQVKTMNTEIKALLDDAGVNAIVYVTKQVMMVGQYQMEAK